MASLILTAVGTVIGGPIGGAIGSILGQQIDNRLFAPKGRTGPRLNELAVQTSSYGAPIPKVFGRARISGSVIWATDIKEDRRKVSAGKGKPKQTVYSYSANFAVALSGRPLLRVGRIWADGKLLRGEGGDFKSETGFRFHRGSEDQAADPLIVAAEGAEGAPAYRGIAYAVFEDFQLADYGNRIPSLSFEVFGEEGPVTVGSLLTALGEGSFDAVCPSLIDGIAVTGDSLRGVAASLSDVMPMLLTEAADRLCFRETSLPGVMLHQSEFGATSEDRFEPKFQKSRRPLGSMPHYRSLAYYDVDRDYQLGTQSAQRAGGGSRERHSEFAASLSSERARTLIERRVGRDGFDREELQWSLPYRRGTIRPGMALQASGVDGAWLVSDVRFEAMAVRIKATRDPQIATSNASADGGRPISEADQVHGPTILHLLDLPWLEDGTASSPAVYAVAAGTGSGWRRAALLQSNDGGVSYVEIGSTAASSVIGVAVTGLAAGPTHCLDLTRTVDVQLLHDGMSLQPASFDAVLAGANLAVMGDELIQFQSAEPIGSATYRLSGLLRGRRGTEHAVSGHVIGERFVLIERETLLPLIVPTGAASVTVLASGIGDIAPVLSSVLTPGLALAPPCPVHLSVHKAATEDLVVSWTRRSRDGWRWVDGADAPLAEEQEAYAIELTPQGGTKRVLNSALPEWTYTVADQAADTAAGATFITFSVRQIGTLQPSRATSLLVPLL